MTGPSDPTVVVYRGPTRQTYSCTPDCSPRITLGDTGKNDFEQATQLYNDFFAGTLKQTSDRNTQAATAGAMSSGRLRRHDLSENRLPLFRIMLKAAPARLAYRIGSAVVDLIFSMAKREVTLANGTAAISRL